MLFFTAQQIRTIPRLALLVLLMIAFAVFGHYWVQGELITLKDILNEYFLRWGDWVLWGGSLLYLLLLSLPFVPRVELGLLLMCVFGQQSILPIYFASIGGIMLAFTAGQCLSKEQISDWMIRLVLLPRSANTNSETDEWVKQPFLSRTSQRYPWLERYLKQYRYVSLMILFNLPGNYLIGGGGGIALAC